MKKNLSLLCLVAMLFEVHTALAGDVKTEKVTLVGKRIVEFVPEGYDAYRTPSLMLVREPEKIGEVPQNWTLIPQFTSVDGKANASLNVPAGTSLYGGGEVTGPLLRNGQKIKLWNTDNGMYRVDGGSRLYQTHPWVLGVRPDGTAFGVLFDSFWKAELITNSDKIEFNTEGAPFRTYVIDRKTPQEVLKGLAELTGTISMPPRWSLGYHQSRFSYVPEARVKEVADTFREKKIPCDVIVVVAFGQILSKEILDYPKFGCINVHASLLPRWRGAAPMQWAILEGDEKTGVTTMQMAEGLDTGDMLLKAETVIEKEDTAETIHDRLSEMGKDLLLETLEKVEKGEIVPQKQDDSLSCYAKMLKKDMGKIDMNWDAAKVERYIRGMNSWPSAYTTFRGKTLKLWRANVLAENTGEKPGTVVDVLKNSFIVQTGDGCLEFLEVQLEGKKRMDAGSFLRGVKIEKGDCLC